MTASLLKTLMLVIISFFSFTAMAQTQAQRPTPSSTETKPRVINRIGLETGVNFPEMLFTSIDNVNDYPDVELFPRFNAGFYSESGVNEYFVTQIGLFYSGGGYSTGKNQYVKIDYISVPFILNFRSKIHGPVAFLIGAGPYGSFAFNAVKRDNNTINRDILSKSNDKVEDNKPYKPYDVGLIFSGAFEYKMPNENILKIGAAYSFGVIDASNEYSILEEGDNTVIINEGAQNRILSIKLTYMIDLLKD